MRPVPALVLVSGFGAFEAVVRNPSGEVALALAADPPPGLEVRSGVLPVSFERAPRGWDELAASIDGRPPALALGLGVQRRDTFRLEARARGRLRRRARPDVDGVPAAAARYDGDGELSTMFDLERTSAALRDAGATRVSISEDAGGFVCERLYYHLLRWSARRAVPALFVHVPPIDAVPVEEQARVLRAFLPRLLRLAGDGARG